MCKIEIKNDLYNVVSRLKKIDENYLVLYVKNRQVFEIHNKNQPFGTYCLTLPYKNLDKRAVDYVLKTRKENFDKLIKEMDISNKRLEQKENEELKYKAKYDLTSMLKYLQKN